LSLPFVQLGEICDLFNGFAFKSADYVDVSNTLSCRMSNIRPGGIFNIDYNARYLPDSFAEKYDQFLLKDGDVVIAMTDLADAPKILGVPTVIETNGRNILLNQRVGKLAIKDSSKVYFPYLQKALNSPKVRSVYKRFAAGGLQVNLGKKDLLSVSIPLPTLEEQKKIADILGAADSVRLKDQQLVEHYTLLGQSLFLEMFGDPVSNTKGWDIKQLKDLSIKIHSGSTPKGGSKVYVDKGIALLRSQNVWKNKLVLNNAVYIDDETHNKMRKSSLKNRDILMTKTGRINTENSSLGRAAMFLGEDDSANVNGHVYLIRLQKNILNEFVLFILTTNEYREYIRSVCVGGIDKRQINKDHLEKFPIIYPPVELQNKFTEQLQLIEIQKKQAQENLEKSEALFNSLLQRAFKGELTESKAA